MMTRLLRCRRFPTTPASYAVTAAPLRFGPPPSTPSSRRAVALPICAALAKQELRQRAASFGTPTSAPKQEAAGTPSSARGGRSSPRGGRGGRGSPAGGRGGQGWRGEERRRDGGARDESVEREPRGEAVPTKGQLLIEAAALERGVARVVLKRGKARLFRDGHPLVYSGAVDRVEGRPPPEAGALVLVADGSGAAIGWGAFNPHSMFRVRVLQLAADVEAEPECALDIEVLLRSRLEAAVQLRRALRLPSESTDVYRLCNSEGDRLSGLIVDVCGGSIVAASSSAWIELNKDLVMKILREVTGVATITWRPTRDILQEEGLYLDPVLDTSEAEATLPQESSPADEAQDFEASDADAASEGDEMAVVREGGVQYNVALGGQKTGFYADQRDSRAYLRSLVAPGSRVLDLCCYSGGFAINAALAGASTVTGVDSSASALQLARSNAELNGVPESVCSFVRADVAPFMREAAAAGKLWDMVVLDPPKLAPNRKSLPRAAAKYRALNKAAMALLAPGGLLMTCSCSGAMTQSGDFIPALQAAASLAGRRITVLREAGAGADHALDPAYPEGSYLTNVLLRVQ